MRFKIKYHPSMFEKYRIFDKTAKYFLKIKDHIHDSFN